MNKEELTNIVNKLIDLGEDKDELLYWLDIFDYLPPNKQNEIFANFKQELQTLGAIR